VSNLSLAIGNLLFRHCYPLYVPLYSFYKAFTDRKERAVLRNLIKPGMTIVDVGANIGIYTRYLAGIAGRSVSVYAFEPSPLNFARLRDNVRSHHNITMIEAAVGEQNGVAELYLSEKANVDHRMYDSGDGRKKVDVALVSLDVYFPTGTQIDFMKIDVQGHEYSVLRGATRLFKENPQMVCLLEFWPFGLAKAGIRPADFLRFIIDLGFTYEVIGGSADVVERSDQKVGAENEFCNLIISKNRVRGRDA
jgi:FkbM family methyltransferase